MAVVQGGGLGVISVLGFRASLWIQDSFTLPLLEVSAKFVSRSLVLAHSTTLCVLFIYFFLFYYRTSNADIK